MGSRWLLFAVLLAGAVVWWARAGQEVAANLGSLERLSTAVAAGAGPAAGGDAALARVAAQLAGSEHGDSTTLVFGGDRNEATWIAYLAYPRLVRDVPSARAEVTLERLAPGAYTLIAIPPRGGSAEATADPAAALRRSLRTRFGFTSASVAYRDASGIVIVEAVR